MKAGFKSEKPKAQGNNNNLKVKKVEYKPKQEKNVSPGGESNENFIEELNPNGNCKKSSDTNFNKILSNNFMELEEKVDFLLQVFKNNGYKLQNKDQEEFLSFNTSFEDSWHFSHLNKRISAAEEGLKNLSLIIEELLKESTQRKETILEKTLGLSGERDMEGMTTTQRINFLKNRNDLLTCFMKALLKVGSFGEISDKLAYLPKDTEFQDFKKESRKHHDIKEQIEKAMEENESDSLSEIISNAFEKESLCDHEDCASKRPSTLDNAEAESFLNHLENSSKQEEVSDCKFNRRAEAEKVIEEIKRKTSYRNYRGKFSQVSDSTNKHIEDVNDNIKLLSNETLLLSSLEQAQQDFFSKFDSPKKNSNNGSTNQVQKQTLKRDEFEYNLNSSRCSQGPVFKTCEAENKTLKKSNNTLSSIPEECPVTVTKYKYDLLSGDQRPNTAPVTTKPPLRSSNKKPVAKEDKMKTNSEINNNIKNKNKSLLNKKPFVRTL